ncbi:MAG: GSCFA domain-containing protein [Ferruginibacter sp.]
MQFHLEHTPKPIDQKINHRHKLMLLGSCFTENIGEKLLAHKFSVLQNPNGILFNPVSVKESLDNYISNKIIGENDLFYLNEAWHSWQHHSRFSSPDKSEAIQKINAATAAAHHWLKQTDFLIITLGSAWVYELTALAENAVKGAVAANNHKAPAAWFNRRLLGMPELDAIIDQMINALKLFNPAVKIIFTISPVRHLREGFVENNRSKAALITSVHHTVDTVENVFYFPAYELLIDDLRDYRFYAEDMVHPNYAATNYVWEKFVPACMEESSRTLMVSINEINAAKNHKPFNPASEAHKKFKGTFSQKLSMLAAQYPYIDFAGDIDFFKK